MAPLLLVRAMGEPSRRLAALYWFTWVVAGVATYLLFSRMGSIVFAMTTLGVWTFNPRQWRKVLVILIVALAIGAALVARSTKMSRFVVTTILKPDRDPGVEQRFGVWREALLLFRSRPITGTGLGTYDEVTYQAGGQHGRPGLPSKRLACAQRLPAPPGGDWNARPAGVVLLLVCHHRQTAGRVETGRCAIPALRRRGAVGRSRVSRDVDQRGLNRFTRSRQPSHEPDHRPRGRVGAAHRSGN